MPPGLRLLAALGLGLGATYAQDCGIRAPDFAFVPDSVAFVLECTGNPPDSVDWDFGDGDTAAANGGDTVRHRYAAKGRYTVFARSADLPIPGSKNISILDPATATAPTHSSTLILDAKRSRAWNVNADNHSVSVHDLKTRARLSEIPVGLNPRTLALDSLGRVWVANQGDATLTVLDGGTYARVAVVALPRASRPYAVAFNPAGTTGYVTLEATGKVLRMDALAVRVTDSVAIFPSPRGLAVSGDGSRVFVTRFLSPGHQGEVAEISAQPFQLTRVIALPYDSSVVSESTGPGVPNALNAVAIAPDGKHAWVVSKKDNVGFGTYVDPQKRPLTFESTVRAAVHEIDLAAGVENVAARRDLDNRSLPWAVAFHPRGDFAFVPTLTSNHTPILDALGGGMSTAIEPAENGDELGPDGAVFSPGDTTLLIHYFLSRKVAVYSLKNLGDSNQFPRLALIPTVENERLTPQVLRGKQVFYNAAEPA
jgi:hypothetical protein